MERVRVALAFNVPDQLSEKTAKDLQNIARVIATALGLTYVLTSRQIKD
jgi:hypothetical protein